MQRISLFLLFIGICMLVLSACNAQTRMNIDQSSGSDYRSMAYQDAVDAGIDPNLYVRQINQESGFDPSAISSAGAQGIAQIMPDTANAWNVDPWNASDALRVAAQHMAEYYTHYGYDYAKALAAYNAGPGAVDNAVYCHGIYWKQYMPSETVGYINAIMG